MTDHADNTTPNHGFNLWAYGQEDWEHRSDFEALDTLLKGMSNNGESLTLSTLTLQALAGSITNNNDLTNLEGDNLSIDANGNLNAAGGGDGSGYTVSDLIASPNGSVQTAALGHGESTEITCPVPDGDTITVYRWGGYTVPDGDAPSGLEVQLLGDGDTVRESENTTDTRSTSGVASYTNTTGSQDVCKLRVVNNTGTAYDGSSAATDVVESFEDGFSAYSGSTGSWSQSTDLAYDGGVSASTQSDYPLIYNASASPAPEPGTKFTARVASSIKNTGNIHSPWVMFGVQGSDSFYEIRTDWNDAGLELHIRDGGTQTILASDADADPTQTYAWYTLNVTWDDGTIGGNVGEITVTLDDPAGNEIGSVQATDTTHGAGGIGFSGNIDTTNNGEVFVDYVTMTESVDEGVGGVFAYEVS